MKGFLFLILLSFSTFAQQQSIAVELEECPIHKLELIRPNHNTTNLKLDQKFEVTFEEGTTEEVKAAFWAATEIWQPFIYTTIPIKIKFSFANLTATTLAASGAKRMYKNFKNAPVTEVWYPVSLAESLAKENLNNDEHDIEIQANISINWSFDTKNTPSENSFDFVTVMVHEIAHGLGFSSSITIEENSQEATLGLNGTNFIYDDLLIDQNQVFIKEYSNPSESLKEAVTTQRLYINPIKTGKDPIEIYTPLVFSKGGSVSHLASSSIMVPKVPSNYVNRSPDQNTLTVLYEMGWIVYGLNGIDILATNKQSPIVYPNPTSNALNIQGAAVAKVEIYNSSGTMLLSKKNASQLDISTLQKGILLIKIYFLDGSVSINRLVHL